MAALLPLLWGFQPAGLVNPSLCPLTRLDAWLNCQYAIWRTGAAAMRQLGDRDVQRLLEFLRQAYAIRNLDAFPAHVISALPKPVPSEITSYNEVNPRRQRITWIWEPDATFPGCRQIFERHIPEHPLIMHYQKTRDGRALTPAPPLQPKPSRLQGWRRGQSRESWLAESTRPPLRRIVPDSGSA